MNWTWLFEIDEAYCVVPGYADEDKAFNLEGRSLLETIAGRPVTIAECKVVRATSAVALPKGES